MSDSFKVLISRLEQLSLEHPSNDTLKAALAHLARNGDELSWDDVRQQVQILEDQGLWGSGDSDKQLLCDLQRSLEARKRRRSRALSTASSSAKRSRDISVVRLPPSAPNPLLRFIPPATLLPIELVDLLDETYFMHLLATDPAKVVPPGKSLLSMMTQREVREHKEDELPSLQEKVEEVIRRAFWDEALDTLSSSEPSVQLRRLKLLFDDLHIALKPLLPEHHMVLATLSAPLSPTSAPLRSAVMHLREVLRALKERCAPARDPYIDAMLTRLDELNPLTSTQDQAKAITDTIRDVLKLADTMKEDLSQFVLGTLGEQQLRSTIRMQALARERSIVLDLWKTEHAVHEKWSRWLAQLAPPFAGIPATHEKQWVLRLMQALHAPTPVFCPLPTKSLPQTSDAPAQAKPAPDGATPAPTADPANALPPPLFFSAPALLYTQNYLQALTIAAALHALLPRPSSPTAASPADFMPRIWTLLLASITDAPPDAGDTKLAHLADELVRAAGAGSAEAARLRAAVERTLRPGDAVFELLMRRVVLAIGERLVRAEERERRDVRVRMQTGRDAERGGRMRLDLGGAGEDGDEEAEKVLVVKGFEDAVLVDGVREAVRRIRGVVRWVEEGWGEIVKGP